MSYKYCSVHFLPVGLRLDVDSLFSLHRAWLLRHWAHVNKHEQLLNYSFKRSSKKGDFRNDYIQLTFPMTTVNDIVSSAWLFVPYLYQCSLNRSRLSTPQCVNGLHGDMRRVSSLLTHLLQRTVEFTS